MPLQISIYFSSLSVLKPNFIVFILFAVSSIFIWWKKIEIFVYKIDSSFNAVRNEMFMNLVQIS